MLKLTSLYTDGIGNYEVIFEDANGNEHPIAFINGVCNVMDTFVGSAVNHIRVNDVRDYHLNIQDFEHDEYIPPKGFNHAGYWHDNKGCCVVYGQKTHRYSERACQKCGVVFCFDCSGPTNIHQGGKYAPDFMTCPCCGHDVLSE